MTRWLVYAALATATAAPLSARAAQQGRDSMTARSDTTITQTQTTTNSRTDTLYQSGGVQDRGPTTSGITTDTTTTSAGVSGTAGTGVSGAGAGVSGSVGAGGAGGSVTTTDTARATLSNPQRTDTTYIGTSNKTKMQGERDNTPDQRAGLAIKGGVSFGNVSNRGLLPGSVSGRNGFALGLALYGGSPVGFGIEGLYVQRGVDNPSFDVNSRRLDYIDVPAYLRLSIPFALQPFVYAGPQASFEIRCRSGTTTLQGTAADCPNTNRPVTSWAGVVGAGLRVNPGGLAISVEGRYVYGLTDLRLTTVTSANSYRTRSFMILGGIGL